ncbi:MAG: M28 family peptidase [Bacteroidales bacterium]|jgi:hypothetical protein|nr:M28 family peptidase [Bacteroidales bacterium]
MKKHILTLCFLFIFITVFAGKFVLIPVTDSQNLEKLFEQNDIKIHYYCNDYVLATTNNLTLEGTVVLDEHAFGDVEAYAIVYCYEKNKEEYLSTIQGNAIHLYSAENFFIMKILSADFKPAKNDGMIGIINEEAKMSQTRGEYPIITEPDANILDCIAQVDTEKTMGYIQALQDFGTRFCQHANHNIARNWIKNKYETMGLDVSLHNFTFNYYGTPYNNDNVIAIQYGTEFPNEYIVLGCHYDTYTYESQSNAPGADDNASGTAGIMETARILSQYDFKRSIIYCSFSAEELGMYGSQAYAQKCKNEGMNILGYFNLDMIGYLKEGNPMKMWLISPPSAVTLADYFVNICSVYFPSVPIQREENLPWGNSDHTSFNQKGYKGIWWFEDGDCDSPYIHHIPGGTVYGGCGVNSPCFGYQIPCLGDVIGPSVNSQEQVKIYTQAMVASIATLALLDIEIPLFPPPTDCKAEYMEETKIKITWKKPEVGDAYLDYIVYQDSVMIGLTNTLEYVSNVTDFNEHCYQVTAIYNGVTESGNSNKSCAAVPLFPPKDCEATFFEDKSIKITWKAPSEVTPDKYSIVRDGIPITQQKELSYIDIVEDYLKHCYKITALYGDKESDYSNESCAVGLIVKEHSSSFKVVPNPTTGELTIDNGQLSIECIEIYDVYGRIVFSNHQIVSSANHLINISHLPMGNYFLKITTNNTVETIKIVKL